jgi:mono/diheme cytochrome c family protein
MLRPVRCLPSARLPVSRGAVLWGCLALLIAGPAPGANPLDTAQCGDCHRLSAPEAGARDVSDWEARKGPDLFYAGTKYRADWLRAWLSSPARIRPAGLHPERHVRTMDGADVLDERTLEPHPAVPPAQIDAIVEALGKLQWGADRVPETIKHVAVPKPLAQLNFVKFKGCASCHRSSATFGGLSGPELYTAWTRIRPEFLWSYIADPQAWDPVAPMPGYGLPPVEVGKLVDYLRQLDEERSDDR